MNLLFFRDANAFVGNAYYQFIFIDSYIADDFSAFISIFWSIWNQIEKDKFEEFFI